MSKRKKTYTFSKTSLTPWLKNDTSTFLQHPTDLFFGRLEDNKIQYCTFQTYCHHGNALRRILVNGHNSLDIFFDVSPEDIINRMQKALESDCSSYYRKLMDFISTYLTLNVQRLDTVTKEEEKWQKLTLEYLPKYKSHCFDNKMKHMAEKDKNEKNEKEYQNWISFHRLQELCEEMLVKAQTCLDEPFRTLSSQPSRNQLYFYEREMKMDRISVQEGLMVSLYSLIPPCRNDLMDVKFCLYDKKKDNYFFKTDEGAGFIILNHYKTMKTYGTCKMDLPSRVTKLIDKFIDKFQPPSPFIFYNRQGGVYKESTFSNHITDIFTKHTDKHINIQTLRKIYATHSTFESIEKTKNTARKMGHSVETHYTYKKNNDAVDNPIRTFSFQNATRQLFDPRFDGEDFFAFRSKMLQKNPRLEVETLEKTLNLLNIDSIEIEDYNENNKIQKDFILTLQQKGLDVKF